MKSLKTAIIIFLLQIFFAFNCAAFELKYLHSAGTDINYTLEINKNNQKTMLDVNRHINSSGSTIDITTNFSNSRIERGGISTSLPQLDGPVSTTVMDNHGKVSSVSPLGSLQTSMNNLGLTMDRDLMASLAISSFPTGDFKVGDSWTKNASTASGANADFIYKIEKENQTVGAYNSVVEISIIAVIDLNEEQEIPEIMQTSYIKGKVSVNGSLFFDLAKGRIVQIDQNISYKTMNIFLDFNGKATIKPGEDTLMARLMIK